MKLTYILYQKSVKLTKLDLTEDDGSDPVEIDHFFHNDLEKYHLNKLSTVRLVQLAGNIVAYFTYQ